MSHVQMSLNQRYISVRYNLLALSMARKRRDVRMYKMESFLNSLRFSNFGQKLEDHNKCITQHKKDNYPNF